MVAPFSLTGFADQSVVSSGLNQPITVEFLPDNRMLVLEKDGTIWIADPESGNKQVYMQLTNINSGQERGLLDITLDPDFSSNGYFYLFYTPSNPSKASIARFEHQDNAGSLTSRGDLSSETQIWQDTDGYLSCCHYGGGLDFGPDGKIWLTSSDKFATSNPGEGGPNLDLPLDLTSSSGKIIRINSDGTIPDGNDGWPANPFIDGGYRGLNSSNEVGNDDSIWGFALRNPFRASWDPVYEKFYIAEVGGNQSDKSFENLHIADLNTPGYFYGWPLYENADFSELVHDNHVLAVPPNNGDSLPIFTYARGAGGAGQGASITGGEVYRGSAFPSEWDGVYFYGDFTRDFIRYLVLDQTGTNVLGDFEFKPTTEIPGAATQIVDIAIGEDGFLYYVLIGSGEVRRVTFDDNSSPDIDSLIVSPSTGSQPLDVTFTAQLSDPNGDPLTYTWTFGDGQFDSGPVPANGSLIVNHTYTSEALFDAFLTVQDATNTTFSQIFQIQTSPQNSPPTIANVTSNPASGDLSTQFTFSGLVTDPDDANISYTWHFGDGTIFSDTLQSGNNTGVTYTYDAEGTYQAFLEVSDGVNLVQSDFVTIQIGIPSLLPVTNGLVFQVDSTIKVGLNGSIVTGILDESGFGNSLIANGDPELIQGGTPTGKNAIRFDGVGDSLLSAEALNNFPGGSSDRTMFFVADYKGNDNNLFFGASYGNGANNQAFGLIIDNNENLAVQGWGGR